MAPGARARTTLAALPVVAALPGGCLAFRPSAGGGQSAFVPPRLIRPGGVALPAGYACGEVWTTPRLLRHEPDGRLTVVARGDRNGPWTGVAFPDGAFYIAEGGELEGGRLLRVGPDGTVTIPVQGLPSRGDHHTDGPAPGPDGWLYFGVGTYTNRGSW